MNRKSQKILALTGVLLLIGLYVATLVFAIIDSPNSGNLFKASIYATVVVPVLLYAYIGVYKYYKKKQEDDNKNSDHSL